MLEAFILWMDFLKKIYNFLSKSTKVFLNQFLKYLVATSAVFLLVSAVALNTNSLFKQGADEVQAATYKDFWDRGNTVVDGKGIVVTSGGHDLSSNGVYTSIFKISAREKSGSSINFNVDYGLLSCDDPNGQNGNRVCNERGLSSGTTPVSLNSGNNYTTTLTLSGTQVPPMYCGSFQADLRIRDSQAANTLYFTGIQCPAPTPKPTVTPTPQPTYTPQPTITPTPYPTYSPKPTHKPYPTHSPYPTNTPQPTYSPEPTVTPYPTYTPKPTHKPYPSHSPRPTHTPYPTETPEPTNTPKPTHKPYPSHSPRPTRTPYPTPSETPEPTSTPKPTHRPYPTRSPKPTDHPIPQPYPYYTPKPVDYQPHYRVITSSYNNNENNTNNENNNENNNDNHNDVNVTTGDVNVDVKNINRSSQGSVLSVTNQDNNNDEENTTTEEKGGSPQVISSVKNGINELPKTGLPLAGIGLSTLLPMSLGMKKQKSGVKNPTSIWYDRQFKK